MTHPAIGPQFLRLRPGEEGSSQEFTRLLRCITDNPIPQFHDSIGVEMTTALLRFRRAGRSTPEHELLASDAFEKLALEKASAVPIHHADDWRGDRL